jgi:FkbM family methyltransferase
VGAYNGLDAYLWKRAYPQAWVVAFEANPKMYACAGSIMWMPTAVGAVDGKVEFWGNDDLFFGGREGMSGGILEPTEYLEEQKPNLRFRKPVKVDCVRLETFCRRWGCGAPDYLRIDVQGAESLVLEGLGKLRPGWVYLEEDEAGETGHYAGAAPLTQLKAKLKEMGYARVGQLANNGLYRLGGKL